MPDELPPPVGKDRPFPWRCFECRKKEVYPLSTDYTTTIEHDGRSYTIRIPDLLMPTCRNCGERTFGYREDERIRDTLRSQVGLLTSEEMKAYRAHLHLNPEEVAEQLGLEEDSISRWENGAIQSRAMDNLLRLYFVSEEARRLLRQGFKKPA